MKKLILSTGLCMTALTVLVFVVYQVAAEPNAQGGATAGEISPIAEQRAKVAFGPNANAVLSLDIDASDNKMNDGNTSGTVAGAGTDVVVEVFITGLAGPIIGGRLSFDTNMLTVKSAAGTQGLALGGTTDTTASWGCFPPGITLPNGYLGTVTLTTASDVTNMAFTVSASMNVGDGTNIGETDRLTVATPLSFNTTPPALTPDFDGDGMVGFSDFLAFAGQFGARRGDGRYQAKYDLSSDGNIDFADFLLFVNSYGQSVPTPPQPQPPTPPQPPSRSPDLIVESPSVSDSTLTPGQSFTLRATVRNRGTARSAATTLRYYQSSNATITTSDTEVGTDSVSGLSASGTGSESISLTAPSSTGTYYYGACVASVSGESNTNNNCSVGVRVTVSSGGGSGGGGSGGGGSGGGSGGTCRVGMVVRPNQSCTVGGGTFRNIGDGCFTYPSGRSTICVGRGFYINGFSGTRVGNDFRIDALP